MKYLKYILIILIFGIGLFYFSSLFNTQSNVEIGEDLIVKIINNDFTPEELTLNGIISYQEKVNISKNVYVPLNFCNLIQIKNMSESNIEKSSEEDGIDESQSFLSDEKTKFLDNIRKGSYTIDKEYKIVDTDIYINLNEFEYLNGVYRIELNDYIFEVSDSFVPLTFDNYFKQMLKLQNVFRLSDMYKQRNYIVFTFEDVTNSHTISIKYFKDLFGYSKDIEISAPFILYDLGICRIID